MKNIYILTILFVFTATCSASMLKTDNFDLSADIVSMLQGSYGIHPMVTSVPSRVRLNMDANITGNNLRFLMRVSASSGSIYAGGTGEYLPINDIATDKSIYNERGRTDAFIDRAQILWIFSNEFELSIGALDVKKFDSKGKGFSHNDVILDEESGFISAHFTRNAGLSFLAERNYPVVPACAFLYNPSEYANFKFILTFLDIEEHIFFTNSWALESSFFTNFFEKEGKYMITLGFVDSHYSYTHHISACLGLEMEQVILQGIYLFGKCSITENHKVSKMFSDVYSHFNFGMGMTLDGKTPISSDAYLGIGASQVFMFDTGHETVLETFLRCKLNENITFSPDIQFIFDPHGSTDYSRDLLFVGGIRVFIKM